MSTATETALGTHSEVGKLRTVMVHRPDLAHERLSPSNCHELLFDDVIWVRRARQEFDAFVDLMRDRGVEVLLVHDLLTQTLADPEAREWLLSRRVRPEEVTLMFAEPIKAWLSEMPAEELATRLTGGVTVQELPDEIRSDLDSPVADLVNVPAERFGGMLVGGRFLAEFVPDGLAWVHLDIAGPAFNNGGARDYTPKGGTGAAVRTIIAAAERFAASL